MGTRLPGCERRNSMAFLKASAKAFLNVALLVVLLPLSWIRKLTAKPAPVRVR